MTAAPAPFPQPTPVKDLLAESSADTVEKVSGVPYLVRGHKTVGASRPKVGKTELLGHDIAKITSDPNEGDVFVMTEESHDLWRMRCQRLGITGGVHFYWKRDIWAHPWPALCKHIAKFVSDSGCSLLVVDTVGQLARIPDMNDNPKVTDALTCLDAIADTGAAVLVMCHQRKSEGSYGLDVLGSTAFTAWADVIVTLHRVKGYPRRRMLRCGLSRFGDEPDILMELSKDRCEYHVIDEGPDAGHTAILTVVDRLVGYGPPGLTRDEIQGAWPRDAGVPQPSDTPLKDALAAAVKSGRYHCEGVGKKRSPYSYCLPQHQPSPDDSDSVFPMGLGASDRIPADNNEGKLFGLNNNTHIRPKDRKTELPAGVTSAQDSARAVQTESDSGSPNGQGVPSWAPLTLNGQVVRGDFQWNTPVSAALAKELVAAGVPAWWANVAAARGETDLPESNHLELETVT